MVLSLETTRLRIRCFEHADWPDLYAYLSLPDVRLFVPEWPETEQQTRDFVAKNVDEAREYALVLRDGGAFIGHVSFIPWFGAMTYELGWAVAPPHQRRGYATEAARAVLAYAFETAGLHRVIATMNPENTASVGVAEKLGMHREAHFRKCRLHEDGSWTDEYFYALLEDDWPPTRAS
jgi:ribosomal-protein-alanine N-acetyltransferase